MAFNYKDVVGKTVKKVKFTKRFHPEGLFRIIFTDNSHLDFSASGDDMTFVWGTFSGTKRPK